MKRPANPTKPPPPPKPESRIPRVVFQPAVYRAMQSGIDQVVNAIRPTLGPIPRYVAIDRGLGNKRPELFDNGGLIARRIVALPDRTADIGAMFIRSLLWRLHERHGDGTATAAVLFQAVYRLGVKHIAAGGNAMRLRRGLEAGTRVLLDELDAQAEAQAGQAALTRLAEALCPDPPLARLLGEVIDIIGEYGQLEIVAGRGRQSEREYYDGGYWKAGLLVREALAAGEQKVTLQNATLFISDLEADDPAEVARLIELARATGAQALVVIVKKLSDSARVALLAANRATPNFRTIPVETPGLTVDDQQAALEDLSVMSGGQALLRVAGQTLGSAQAEHLGRARTAWVDRMNLGLVGGQGNPRALRQHLSRLKEALARATQPEAQERLRLRLGKLSSGAATLSIGGATEAELTTRKALAERTVAALRGALRHGVVPGGGAALLAASPALRARLNAASDPDEQAAYRILLQAVEAPLRAIVRNAGGQPSAALDAVRRAGRGHGYDVLTERVVDMRQAGIMDITLVLRAAVQAAVTGAALALTVDVLVQHRTPATVLNP